jgi:hypothetical protein
MADFRKWFIVLAVMAVTAASAFAQGQFICATSPAVPATLRGGGLTEEVGDVVMNCSGGSGAPASGSFQVLMPGSAVTNRIGALVPGKGYPTNAALTVEDATTGVPFYTVQGYLQPTVPVDTPASRNVLSFPNVVIPTGSNSTVRIANIRVAAPVVTSTAVATSVFEIISTSPANIIPITNSTQQVGVVFPGLQFGLTDCSGGGAPGLSFQQCTDLNISDGNPTSALTFGVRFTEGFSTAFKILAPTATAGGGNAEFTGRTYIDTTTLNAFADVAGTGDHATRLIFTLTNVPAGVTVRVTDRELGSTASVTTGSSVGATAINVPGANSDGSGGTKGQTAGGGVPTCPGYITGSNPAGTVVSNNGTASPTSTVHFVTASSSGSTVFAVWEVTDQTLQTDSLVFGVQVSFVSNPGAGSPALTGTTPPAPAGNFAPQSTVNYADATSPIPRFATQPIPATPTLSVVPCVTNLLFPYVTSTSGYDTGLAIVNTSKDNGTGSTDNPAPFNTSAQTGDCTVYFFGNNAISPQSTGTVNPGSLVKFTMLSPLPSFTQATAGFEGYIIARCNFQYAHGLAFIVDTRVPGFGSEAYLALVIPDQGGGRPPVNFAANGGAGEQLIH